MLLSVCRYSRGLSTVLVWYFGRPVPLRRNDHDRNFIPLGRLYSGCTLRLTCNSNAWSQTWKTITTSRRAGGEAAGSMPSDQANSPGYTGQVSNILSTRMANQMVPSPPFFVSKHLLLFSHPLGALCLLNSLLVFLGYSSIMFAWKRVADCFCSCIDQHT